METKQVLRCFFLTAIGLFQRNGGALNEVNPFGNLWEKALPKASAKGICQGHPFGAFGSFGKSEGSDGWNVSGDPSFRQRADRRHEKFLRMTGRLVSSD